TAARPRDDAAKPAAPAVPAARKVEAEAEESDDRPRRRGTATPPKRPNLAGRRGEQRRRAGKITIVEALDDGDERTRSLASMRRQRERERNRQIQQSPGEALKVIRDVVIPEAITVQELANRMAERSTEVIRSLMK